MSTTTFAVDMIGIEDAPEVSPLATIEQEALDRCEAIIERGVQTFRDVGDALAEIRDKRLYRQHYDTWEEYCQDRWGIGGSRARQLIGAASVAREIETVTTVTLSNERQARELAKAAPADRPAVITRATEIAGDRAPTAQHIAQAANEIAQPDLPPEFAIVQRRMAKHDHELTSSIQGQHRVYAIKRPGMTGVAVFDWANVLSRLERMEAEPPDREALIAARKAEDIARSRANRIARGDPAYADDPAERGAAAGDPATELTADEHRIVAAAGYEWQSSDVHPGKAGKSVTYHLKSLGSGMGVSMNRPQFDAWLKIHAPIERAEPAPPAPAGDPLPTKLIALALADLDAILPADLDELGYFWKSATPPTIAHNVGNWQAEAPTVEQALAAAYSRDRSKAMLTLVLDLRTKEDHPFPGFPTDLPALMESISRLIAVTNQWSPGGQRKVAPALAVLRAVGRAALEASKTKS